MAFEPSAKHDLALTSPQAGQSSHLLNKKGWLEYLLFIRVLTYVYRYPGHWR